MERKHSQTTNTRSAKKYKGVLRLNDVKRIGVKRRLIIALGHCQRTSGRNTRAVNVLVWASGGCVGMVVGVSVWTSWWVPTKGSGCTSVDKGVGVLGR